jgi:hypothetical protein
MAKVRAASWARIMSVGLTFLFATCGEDEWRDKNRPATFFDICDPAAPKCESPFSCLGNPELSGNGYCTLACASDSDCPQWTATGHCAGPFQSRCQQGVCQYGCR